MGMYDIVKIKSIKHKNFKQEHLDLEFQTKDMDPNFFEYVIDKNLLYFKDGILNYTGDLDLIAYHNKKFIEYVFSFYEGCLTAIEEVL